MDYTTLINNLPHIFLSSGTLIFIAKWLASNLDKKNTENRQLQKQLLDTELNSLKREQDILIEDMKIVKSDLNKVKDMIMQGNVTLASMKEQLKLTSALLEKFTQISVKEQAVAASLEEKEIAQGVFRVSPKKKK